MSAIEILVLLLVIIEFLKLMLLLFYFTGRLTNSNGRSPYREQHGTATDTGGEGFLQRFHVLLGEMNAMNEMMEEHPEIRDIVKSSNLRQKAKNNLRKQRMDID